VPNIKKLTCVVPEKNVTEIILWQFFQYQKYSKFRQTGSGHAADSKLSYTIQFSILMLCAKYKEAGLCGSWEKCNHMDNNVVELNGFCNHMENNVVELIRLCTHMDNNVLELNRFCNHMENNVVELFRFM